MIKKTKLAVWKFASCDGCQLSLLNCEDELLTLTQNKIEISYFLEASRKQDKGPYDLSLVEGSITTESDRQRIQHVREVSRHVVTIGACATSGGIQALRNFSDIKEFMSVVYAKPEYISTLATSTPISDHIKLDFELRGCPINKEQLLDVILSFANDRKPNISGSSVCTECKLKGNECLLVTRSEPCLGPITHMGCGALCPSFNRPCYGCYGIKERPNLESLTEHFKKLGYSQEKMVRIYRSFNAATKELAEESKRNE